MVNSNPKVSVIIPSYNCAQYISEAIESVLNQTYQDFELIIIDDGSQDNTKVIIEKYATDRRIKYFSRINEGVSSSRNYGIKKASGEYLSFLDADDFWKPSFLQAAVSLVLEGKYDWVLANTIRLNVDRSGINRAEYYYEDIKLKVKKYGSLILVLLLHGTMGLVHGSIIRKECLLKNGILFDENMDGLEDRDIEVRLLKEVSRTGFLDEYLTYYRRVEGFTHLTKIGGTRRRFDLLYLFYRKYKMLYRNLGLKKDLSNLFWKLGGEYIFTCKNIFFGVKCIFLAFLYCPPTDYLNNLLKFTNKNYNRIANSIKR